MSTTKQMFALLLQFILAVGSSSGCNAYREQSSEIDIRLVKRQTGLDPSKIYSLSGKISSIVVEKGMKSERTALQFDITSIDGIPLDSVLSHLCNIRSSDVKAGDSGEFFGFLEITTKGSLEATDYAKSLGIPQYEELIMNSSDFNFYFEIQILDRVPKS